MEFIKIQDNLKKGYGLNNYSIEELKYLNKPLGKAIYTSTIKNKGRPRKNENEKCKPSDRIICEICNKEYTRSASFKHKSTQYHQLHERMNKKLRKVLLED